MERRSRKIMLLPLLVLALSSFVYVKADTLDGLKKVKDLLQNHSKNLQLQSIDELLKINLSDDTSKGDLSDEQVDEFSKVLADPKKILQQEINVLSNTNTNNNEDAVTEKKIKKIFVNVAESVRKKADNIKKNIEKEQDLLKYNINKVTESSQKIINNFINSKINDNKKLHALVNDENNIDDDDDDEVDDENDDDEEDDIDDDDDDDDVIGDEDEDDEGDDEDDDDDDDDTIEDIKTDEEIMTECPDYCRCSGQYSASTTAVCSKLIDRKKSFTSVIGHLKIENADDLKLGPHALIEKGLEKLESISITGSRISILDRSSFDGLTYLFSVNMSKDGNVNIHPNIFENNTQLSLLAISGHSNWQNWTTNNDYLFNAPSVTELDFSWNEVSHLPTRAFSKMPNLVYLNLKSNRLGKIDKILFEPLKSLIELDLSSNMLSNIPSDVFVGIELQTLRIGDNFLHSLRTINATKLTTLDVSNNHIKIIEQNDFSNLQSLENLIISWNNLHRIHDHAFAHIKELDHLDISGNNLTYLSDHHFRNNPRLEILLINDNPNLRVIPKFILKGMEYNKFNIYRFECSNCGLRNISYGTFDTMPALSKLNLAKNYIADLPNGLFKSLSSLSELDLSDNAITFIKPNMFDGAVSLSKLNIANNPITSLQVEAFKNTKSLSHLDVSGCFLRRIWSEARTPFKSLRYLTVYENKLEHITVEELKAMPKLSSLDLSGNPFVCDNDFMKSMEYLIKLGIKQTHDNPIISNIQSSENIPDDSNLRNYWSDLVKKVCLSVDDGPPPRRMPKPSIKKQQQQPQPIYPQDINHSELSRNDIEKIEEAFNNHGQIIDDDSNDNWSESDIPDEDDVDCIDNCDDIKNKSMYLSWYGGQLWPLLVGLLFIGTMILIILQISYYMKQRNGHSPVLRGLSLYPGLDGSKNSGAVYKQLQEEIPTPKMTKRGGFFLISPWTQSDVIPESV